MVSVIYTGTSESPGRSAQDPSQLPGAQEDLELVRGLRFAVMHPLALPGSSGERTMP